MREEQPLRRIAIQFVLRSQRTDGDTRNADTHFWPKMGATNNRPYQGYKLKVEYKNQIFFLPMLLLGGKQLIEKYFPHI
jgi:hypothetical protein